MLDECLRNRRPVYEVVAVVGSTEEGAVDPLSDVLALRERFHERGLAFPIHADGAWGGYFTSMIRADTDPMARADQRLHRLPILNSYLHTQLEAVSKVDSVTLDPHKSGYIPYPAGALCYRNSAMRDLLTFSAPVMFHGGAEPTVGIYGLEGSKSGAPPAAAYLSLQVIRPTESGHGRLLGQAMFCAKRLYAALRTMFGPGDPFIVVPLARLPAEIAGQGVDEQVEEVRRLICDRTNEEIIADPEAMKLLREIGPDLNIVSYAFNFRLPDGRLNTDLDLTNQLNRRIYDRLSIDPDEDIYGYELIVSTTEVAAADYGTRFVEDYKARLGTSASPGTTIQILRSVVMDPWVSDTSHGAFLDTLEDVLRRTATLALGDVAAAHEGVTTQVLTPAE
jgi:hypothetical protein